jgi:hypothetical protein
LWAKLPKNLQNYFGRQAKCRAIFNIWEDPDPVFSNSSLSKKHVRIKNLVVVSKILIFFIKCVPPSLRKIRRLIATALQSEDFSLSVDQLARDLIVKVLISPIEFA